MDGKFSFLFDTLGVFFLRNYGGPKKPIPCVSPQRDVGFRRPPRKHEPHSHQRREMTKSDTRIPKSLKRGE